jgi:hypothetical protein
MSTRTSLVPLAALLVTVAAHGGHDEVPEGEAISGEPIVSFQVLPDRQDLSF